MKIPITLLAAAAISLSAAFLVSHHALAQTAVKPAQNPIRQNLDLSRFADFQKQPLILSKIDGQRPPEEQGLELIEYGTIAYSLPDQLGIPEEATVRAFVLDPGRDVDVVPGRFHGFAQKRGAQLFEFKFLDRFNELVHTEVEILQNRSSQSMTIAYSPFFFQKDLPKGAKSPYFLKFLDVVVGITIVQEAKRKMYYGVIPIRLYREHLFLSNDNP
jgi:hypothetical protein